MSKFRLSVRFNAMVHENDKYYYVCWGGPCDICTNIDVDPSSNMLDVLKYVIQCWSSDDYIIDELYVLTSIRNCELDMTPQGFVDHSDGATKRAHIMHQQGYKHEGVGGQIRVNFVYDKNINRSGDKNAKIYLHNRNEVDEPDRELVCTF